ncbi:MAG: hypothetical protein RML45_09025 [Acetobacteraceae bacterium]|nr:hypothetical protein [Acetobacteraceae bacterium]
MAGQAFEAPLPGGVAQGPAGAAPDVRLRHVRHPLQLLVVDQDELRAAELFVPRAPADGKP